MARASERVVASLSLLVVLTLLAPAPAQTSPWAKLFGPRGDKAAPKAPPPDPRRLAEIQVEIAWLADPLTFPYFLEAHAAGGVLEVRGYVPTRAVHDHALNIARVYSSLPVTDAVKEHPSLQVRPGQMSPQQLHQAVTTALREALPKFTGQLQVQCGNSGQVVVAGTVPSHEDRLLVSHALRRLYGCVSVQNLTRVQGETAVPGPTLANSTGIAAKAAAPSPRPSAPQAKATPLLEKKPAPPAAQETKAPEAPKTEVVTAAVAPPRAEAPEKKGPAPATATLAAQLKQKIEESCPGVKGVRIEVVAPTEFRIEITATTEEQVTTFAGKILMLPELQDYRADLQFKVMP